ncbi:amidohydrolase family protein [Variovorax sp. 375MFSha3.1]|uniref:amidohydrolase family protein n=1 Tax=unclassified Variovorax TaxID=663243 RepID=UPI003AAE6024
MAITGRHDAAHQALPGEKQRIFPEGACDTHLHVFGSPEAFPFIAERSYTPPPATIEQYWSAYGPLGMDRCVLVQPSVYGRDHSLLKRTLAGAAPGSMRGVAVIFEDTPDAEIEELHRLGVRGARCNALFSGGVSAAGLQSIADRVKGLGWHIQLLVNIDADFSLVQRLAEKGMSVVVDHFGHPSNCGDIDSRGVKGLRSLLQEGCAWVKFSGAYRISATGSGVDPAVLPLAHSLAHANPDRIVWGSDWPHPGVDAKSTASIELANLITHWFPEEIRRKALVENPTRLYWND